MEDESNELNLIPSTAAQDGVTPAPQKKKAASCCDSLKIFFFALCFTYFTKAFSASHMKSSITQIERRFDLSSSTVGFVDGSFEYGNLMVIVFVSYFGAKLHRPRIIAAGCFVMALGSFLSAMPHFFMGPYKYETVRSHVAPLNNLTGSADSISPCLANRTLTEDIRPAECVKETSSHMWVYVMVGNMLRGIGETPIIPLGVSYIDDFSDPGNTPLYIACLHTVAMFGPIVGFMLGSYFAKLYVDIGFVNLDTVTITPQDTRWVGAWWLGCLVAGAIALVSGIPFCFLPKSIEGEETQPSPEEQKLETSQEKHHNKASVKGFFHALKSLACNRLYVILMIINLLQMNGFLGFMTYKPKYMEQQYGQSIAQSNFITGATTFPAAALGMFLGGFLMKRYRMGLLTASKLVFVLSFLAFIMSLSVFITGCENGDVAGITVSYNGSKLETWGKQQLLSSCNADCSCSSQQWDPVCGANNITYVSACLAGCKSSTGSGKHIVYQSCSCIESMGFPSVNSSVVLGSCPRGAGCDTMFIIYVIMQALITLSYSSGATPAYVILLWCLPSELKSLGVGVYMLLIRTLAGIPSPIYFGALIDKTCLMWGTKPCGGRGACRMYDTHSFRNTFQGLTDGLWAPSFIFFLCFISMVKKKHPVKKGNEAKRLEPPEDGGKGANDAPEIEKQTFI
ncbi:solute carrier organic anion transporter family member 1C1-like isoform X1 [Engystomops pustulosus]|uniref:solute carrier organic anion transporter family member 1C1-like isoform X1 n=1 Tax=Engystomops pustulosus TaxID=76066 RepID=UPI003AFAC33D